MKLHLAPRMSSKSRPRRSKQSTCQQSDEQKDEAEDKGQRTQTLQAFVVATCLFDTIRTAAQCSKVRTIK